MIRRSLATLAVALLACVPAAHAERLVGFNDDWAHATRAVQVTKRFRANSERLQVFWRDVEPRPGAFDWYGWDRAYDAMVGHGVAPLLDVVTAPAWARDASCDDNTRCMQAPAHDADFAGFVAQMVRRYPRLRRDGRPRRRAAARARRRRRARPWRRRRARAPPRSTPRWAVPAWP